jgi:hypothetical protein
MNWFSLVGSIFKPAAELIDNLHTSDHEKLQIKQAMFELQIEAFNKAEEYETKLLDAKKTIITAEAQSQSWIARNWRPITMLTFLFLVVLDSLGLLPFRLAGEAWTLLQIGLGGYVVGRSAEKVTNVISNVKK